MLAYTYLHSMDNSPTGSGKKRDEIETPLNTLNYTIEDPGPGVGKKKICSQLRIASSPKKIKL